jgi:hypothetical protein
MYRSGHRWPGRRDYWQVVAHPSRPTAAAELMMTAVNSHNSPGAPQPEEQPVTSTVFMSSSASPVHGLVDRNLVAD